MDEHSSLGFGDPSRTSLDVGRRSWHTVFCKAVCEVKFVLTADRPGIMVHDALLPNR